jgi:hypothetical protein
MRFPSGAVLGLLGRRKKSPWLDFFLKKKSFLVSIFCCCFPGRRDNVIVKGCVGLFHSMFFQFFTKQVQLMFKKKVIL